MVEQQHTCGEDNLGVARANGILAEVDDLIGGLLSGDELLSGLSVVQVTEHLETYQMVVRRRLVRSVLDVEALNVLEHAHIERLPVLVTDMSGNSLRQK